MSQPPPPPNQPPSGGFGGPQDPSYGYPQQSGGGTPPPPPPGTPAPGQPPTPPPSGGYGYPQTPPPSEGYGYPQTPPPSEGYGYPQTPPPSGGYGYPQTPPPGEGYGYPQTPPPGGGYSYPQTPQTPPPGQNPYSQAGQNPYGQPPTTPMPASGGPTGGNGNKKLIAILASVVAVAVIAVGAVFFVTKDDGGGDEAGDGGGKGNSQGSDGGGGGGDVDVSGDPKAMRDVPPETIAKPQDDEADIAWSAEQPKKVTSERSKQAHGLLFFGGNVVKYEPDGLRAYNIDSGKEAWFVKAVRGDSCSMAPTSGNAGKTLVQWGAKCEKAMGVDLANGKELWEKDLPERNGEMARADHATVAVSGNLGGIAWIGGSAGFRLSDGKELWTNVGYDSCRDEGYAGGDMFLVNYQCSRGDSSLVKYDQKGEKDREWKVPKGAVIQRVLSTDPLVVALSQDGKSSRDIANVAVLSDDLKLTKRITVDPERYNYACSPTHALDGCHNAIVDKESNLLFLETDTYEGKERSTAAIVAIDLKSGKTKWTAEPEQDGRVTPVGMHDNKLLMMERGSYDGGAGLTQLELTKGKAEPFLNFSADEREQIRDSSIVPYWVDNTLFITSPRMYSKADLNKVWLSAIR